ncbi:MAG: protease modulator HflC [Dehalococcoidia bacterium]
MKKIAVIAAVAIFLLVVLFQSFYTVDETEQVIILQMGEYKKTVDKPGLHAKLPFVQTPKSLDKRVIKSDAPSTGYLTLDKKNVEIDHLTRWRITEPVTFYKSIGSEEQKAHQRINAVVVSELRDELASFDLVDIISIHREAIMDEVTERTAQKVIEFGVDVIDVRIKRTELPENVEDNVFARMRAEREREAKKYRAEGEELALETEAEADRQATVIMAQAYRHEQSLKGQGDGMAASVYAAAYEQAPSFYSLMRALEVYTAIMDEQTTLVLSTQSDLLKYLTDIEPEEE